MAEIYEKLGNQEKVHKYMKKAADLTKIAAQKWKDWLVASRMEARFKNYAAAEKLLSLCCKEIPEKQQATGFLELAKFKELTADNLEEASEVLRNGRA